MPNLDLWNAVEKTPIEHTKPITGKSYSGNSPKPHYLVHRATETFGPCGIGWGFSVLDERMEEGEAGEKVHIARVAVWYKWNGEKGTVEHIGGTVFSGKRKNGSAFTDEDAPKKSVTDALVKALSLIGFAGDIFLGRYDDSKYVAELRQEEQQAKKAAEPEEDHAPSADAIGWATEVLSCRTLADVSALRNTIEFKTAWKHLSKVDRAYIANAADQLLAQIEAAESPPPDLMYAG